MGGGMGLEERIRSKLLSALEPTRLEIVNESQLHAGHRGSPATGESHFRVVIEAEMFKGRSRLERHRLINEVLAAELGEGVHALAVTAHAPGERW
jgi:BolA family transcriptional regulator, general stress-responsive regulator